MADEYLTYSEATIEAAKTSPLDYVDIELMPVQGPFPNPLFSEAA
jgi:hypothetical protein